MTEHYEQVVQDLVNTEDEQLVQFTVSDRQDESPEFHRESIKGLREWVGSIFQDDEDDVDAESMTVAQLIECLETCDYNVDILK